MSEYKVSWYSEDGDDVDMKDEDIALYSILPFGQFWMRIFKFNGSMDNMWLWLFSLPTLFFIYAVLDIYSSTATYLIQLIISYALMAALGSVPGIWAKQKKIKKAEPGNLFSYSMILPLVARCLIVIPLAYAFDEFSFTARAITTEAIMFLILMFSNFLNITFEVSDCEKNNLDTLGTFLHVLMDTFAQYGFIYLFTSMSVRARVLAFDTFSAPVPYFGDVGDILELIFWIIGAIVAHILTKMINKSFNKSDKCNTDGTVSALRKALSGIIFLVGLLVYLGQIHFTSSDY